MITGAPVNVLDYGADSSGASDSTSAIQTAITANSAVYIPAGTYKISAALQIRKNNFSLFGDGSGVSILKLVNGGTAVNILNVGKIDTVGAGDEPWNNINVSGLCLDGNRSTNVPGAYDINGWGILTAVISYSSFSDLRVINCWVAGAGNEINSNYNTWSNISIENCGHDNATYPASQGYPSFDINSSKYCSYSNIVTTGGYAGFRVLDNCWNNIIQVTINTPIYAGFLMGNQPVNSGCYGNIINVAVYGGCVNQGIVVGVKCWSNTITGAVYGATGVGVYEVENATSGLIPGGNTYTVSTSQCGQQSCLIGGNSSSWNITSKQDGGGGAVGDYYAVDVIGTYNQITANISDDDTPKVRGLAIRAAATNNSIVALQTTTLVSVFDLYDTSNTTKFPTRYSTGSSNVQFTLTLAGAWLYSYGVVPTYSKDSNGYVSVNGVVYNGTGVIATLPVGYRPATQLVFPTLGQELPATAVVAANGEITIGVGAADRFNLQPIRFFAGYGL